MRISDWSSDVCSSDLEVYANIAEFGYGIYGVEAAAQRYFGTSSAALNSAQSARLAAVLPSPRRWHAARPGPYVLARQAWVERQMHQLGGPEYLSECCGVPGAVSRSEEHTSELQSLMRISYAVFCLKKKKQHNNN